MFEFVVWFDLMWFVMLLMFIMFVLNLIIDFGLFGGVETRWWLADVYLGWLDLFPVVVYVYCLRFISGVVFCFIVCCLSLFWFSYFVLLRVVCLYVE